MVNLLVNFNQVQKRPDLGGTLETEQTKLPITKDRTLLRTVSPSLLPRQSPEVRGRLLVIPATRRPIAAARWRHGRRRWANDGRVEERRVQFAGGGSPRRRRGVEVGRRNGCDVTWNGRGRVKA